MKETIVTDSTCLIGLERINSLDILPALFDPVLIPPEVEREFGSSLEWLKVESPTDQALVNALRLVVDDGEAEAIALASERKVKIIVDDRQARIVARKLNIGVVGTVGCLLRAKRVGIIPAVKPLINNLEVAGFHLSEALIRETLRLAGE